MIPQLNILFSNISENIQIHSFRTKYGTRIKICRIRVKTKCQTRTASRTKRTMSQNLHLNVYPKTIGKRLTSTFIMRIIETKIGRMPIRDGVVQFDDPTSFQLSWSQGANLELAGQRVNTESTQNLANGENGGRDSKNARHHSGSNEEDNECYWWVNFNKFKGWQRKQSIQESILAILTKFRLFINIRIQKSQRKYVNFLLKIIMTIYYSSTVFL